MTGDELRIRCPVCLGESIHPAGIPRLDRCLTCGFIFFPVGNDAALLDLYDEEYFSGEEYPDYLGQQAALRRSMRRHLRQMAAVQPLGGAVLEIGSAYGFFLDEARAHFNRLVGIDVCRAPTQYAREQLRLDVRLGNVLTHDFSGQRFDVICLWDTIEHLADPRAVLERCASLLDDNGAIFLTTGDIGSLNARMRGRGWRQIHPPSHVSYFSRDTMTRLLNATGLSVVRIETAAYFHTIYNVLASIELRGGTSGRVAGAALRIIGPNASSRVGLWLNLGDIMFVAARKSTALRGPRITA